MPVRDSLMVSYTLSPSDCNRPAVGGSAYRYVIFYTPTVRSKLVEAVRCRARIRLGCQPEYWLSRLRCFVVSSSPSMQTAQCLISGDDRLLPIPFRLNKPIIKIFIFTFMLPCIVIDFFLNNQPDALIIQIYSVIKLYMFRASYLPIIRSFLLYFRHW